MSRRNTHTTADYMPWSDAIYLINRLYKDGQYRMSLLIGCGVFFGLRISDLRMLRWSMLLNGEKFEIQEKKTNKYRQIKINSDFQRHIRDCYQALGVDNPEEHCFLSSKKVVYSTQRINVLLKEIIWSLQVSRRRIRKHQPIPYNQLRARQFLLILQGMLSPCRRAGCWRLPA